MAATKASRLSPRSAGQGAKPSAAQAQAVAVRKKAPGRLRAIDVVSFDRYEPAILAALVTEDPLLIIGRSGTGKTFLLNTLSEALGLEHRHYNASLISFDDLVGFPYPNEDHTSVKFLETPATVWGAESVLIDEISRCKPEHQNRLFSLIHERRVQGIALSKLRFRWAAMNPCSADQDGVESYTGSEALDPALADRFALFVQASDWLDLDESERVHVTWPAGEGKIAGEGGRLRAAVAAWCSEFEAGLQAPSNVVLAYVTTVVTALNGAGVRISPRRARLMARSLIAATIVAGRGGSTLYRLVLDCSLPHVTWGEAPSREAVAAAHRLAWEAATAVTGHWVHRFLAQPALAEKARILVEQCADPDQGSQGIAQWLAAETKERAAALAFALYPAAVAGRLPVGAEGVNDLGRVAAGILAADGELEWRVAHNNSAAPHPETARKLVMDYYGPRVPIGGGALSGKHLSHIDRVGAYAARDAAVRAVRGGAGECLVRLAYAPNMADPLEVSWEMTGRGARVPQEFFRHDAMIRRYGAAAIGPALARGRHFYDERLPWNRGGLDDDRGRSVSAQRMRRTTAVKLAA